MQFEVQSPLYQRRMVVIFVHVSTIGFNFYVLPSMLLLGVPDNISNEKCLNVKKKKKSTHFHNSNVRPLII